MNFKPSVKELNIPKSSFSHCQEYIMKVKIVSRVLVGFDETTDLCGRTDADADVHGFLERLPHKSPLGANIMGGAAKSQKCLISI